MALCRKCKTVRSLYIQVQETPNPLSLKFLPGQAILDHPRTYEYSSVASAKDSPLAMELFRVDGVKSVFFGEDFITITKKDEETDWGVMRAEIFSTIANYIESGKPIIRQSGSAPVHEDTAIHEDDDDTVAMIKELLDSRVRPMVQEDGGDVTYMGFENGVVKLQLKGSCTGCPSSSVTLKSGIQNMLQFYVPEVKEVVEVTTKSDDLVQQELEKFEKSRGIVD
ncbi:NifU-like protein [Ancylostoma caninum]|uniref:NFU1 iron-sulfur cluster scaffold homolog, mitochondrial n=2 Tax=Ancylostoma TaxID=29169 RepID=A0A368H599_ANCCA|nr:NifU-like protein [Ancylostoma caninum]